MQKVILYTLSGILALLLLIALNTQMRRTAAAELALTENTLAAVAEASAEMENLTLALDKVLLTTSARRTSSLLSQIILSADRTQSCIAELPDTQGQRAAILDFLSRLTQLAQHALADLTENGSISNDDRSVLTEMLSNLRLLQSELGLAQQDLMTGAELDQAFPVTSLTAPPTSAELVAYKALPSAEIGSGAALQIGKEFVGTERVTSVSHAPDTSGALPVYGVTIQTPDVQLNLEVTRRGGKVLLMYPETAAFPMRLSPEECSARALSFLQSRGFAQMEATWYQVYDGLCVVTCVYVQNGVLVWPDRVLVQVRMDTGEVVGLEARSYWRNHIPRKLQSPLLTAEEAAASLFPGAEPAASRLCLLPSDGQERLCWQFSLTIRDDDYISYIDALTGEELLLEKIMQLEFGAAAA